MSPAPSRPRSSRVRGSLNLSAIATGAALGALAGFIIRDLDLPGLVSFELPREPLVLLAAFLGAVLGATRFRWVLGAMTLAFAALWCVVAFSPLSGWLSRGLTRTEVVEPADAVFVSCSGLRSGAQRSAELRNRFTHAIDLVVRGKAPRLVVTESKEVAAAAIARQVMDTAGVTAELVVAGRAETTREEALVIGALAREHGYKLVLLVTSPIHSRRASAALEKEGVTVVSTPSAETRFDLETLDTWSDRLAAFGSVIHERFGFLVYARRGWIGTAAD